MNRAGWAAGAAAGAPVVGVSAGSADRRLLRAGGIRKEKLFQVEPPHSAVVESHEMAHAHKGKPGKKGSKRPEEDEDINAVEIVKAAETAVAGRAAILQAESDAELQAKRDRKAAIRAKGLTSLPGARKGGDLMAAAGGRVKTSEGEGQLQ